MVTKRDNYLTFSGDGLIGGTFYVTDSKVSPDQGTINHGLMHFDKKKRLDFYVGRHGTSDVANWFKRKLPNSNQNTFGHQPGKLNFAAMGTLTLRFKGGDFWRKTEYAFTFRDIVLAQGSSGGNNWWFGGVDCKNSGDHRVKTTGKATRPSTLDFEFLRGDNKGRDIIEVFPVTANGMKYRDNEVVMCTYNTDKGELHPEFKPIVNGSFTVTSHSVPKDQDPLEEIYDGMVKKFDSDGKLDFRVGRNGSKEVAKWFNDRIRTEQNTFGHKAGELNFAMIGDLRMEIKGGQYGDGINFKIEGVALAQGSAGWSNNWWFGGLQAESSKSRGDAVTCKAQCTEPDKEDRTLYFDFQRGSNTEVNQVLVWPPDHPIFWPPDPILSVHGVELSNLIYHQPETFIEFAESKLPYVVKGFMDDEKTGTQGAVLYSKKSTWNESRDIVVVFRGSEMSSKSEFVKDWIDTNANTQLVDFELAKTAKVHNGFQTAFTAVEGAMHEFVCEAIDSFGGLKYVDRILVTGHSLGGALAVLASLSLFDEYKSLGTNRKIHLYTYGAPRVGNQNFVKYYNERIHHSLRFWTYFDPVPRLLQMDGYDVNQQYCLSGNGSISNPHSVDLYGELIRRELLSESFEANIFQVDG